jgi:hypothetical protein
MSSDKRYLFLGLAAVAVIIAGLAMGVFVLGQPDDQTVRVNSKPVVEVFDPKGGVWSETMTVRAKLEAKNALEKAIETPDETETTTAPVGDTSVTAPSETTPAP